VLIGASKLTQLQDNLAATALVLTQSELAELEAATPLPAAYPNWFIENLVDQQALQALK
jgi:aryl-alcohol dehydrogenase-like predicted oxidoreductase